jgi:hypothetical protein
MEHGKLELENRVSVEEQYDMFGALKRCDIL